MEETSLECLCNLFQRPLWKRNTGGREYGVVTRHLAGVGIKDSSRWVQKQIIKLSVRDNTRDRVGFSLESLALRALSSSKAGEKKDRVGPRGSRGLPFHYNLNTFKVRIAISGGIPDLPMIITAERVCVSGLTLSAKSGSHC